MNRMAPSTALLVTGLIGLVGLGACSTGAGTPRPHPRRRPRRHRPQQRRRRHRPRRHSTVDVVEHRRPAATPTSAGAYPAADVCTYLTGQLPTLTAIGAPVGVQASLAGNLFGFFQSHGIPADGAQLEAATLAQCPDVRTQILKLAGLTSFAEL